MAFFSFGKRVKNQRFEYIPRYYDPAKEALEERIKMNSPEANAQASEKDSAALAKLRIQDGLRRKARGNQELTKKTKTDSMIRLFVVLAVLLTLTWMFLNSNMLLRLFQWLDSSNAAAQ